MAGFIWIQEYERPATQDFGPSIQVGEEPPISEKRLAIEATERKMEFNPRTRLAIIQTSGICQLDIRSDPNIKGVSRRIPADIVGFPIGLPNDQELSLAVKETT